LKNISISEEQLKQIPIIIVLAICLCLAVFVILWANEPERRPLIQNILVVDAVKIIDVLDVSGIPYTSNLANKMILVNDEDMDRARLALAKVGYVVEYPDIKEMIGSNEACSSLETTLKEQAKEQRTNRPLFEQPWFLKIMKLVMGALVIIVLILSVVRPALFALIGDDTEDENET
jgi:flagellar biosynthesis/type III secretory pathway M-ring protein FliF/YscJ